MAWTNPRTWVTGETVTDAMMNTHVRDNMLEMWVGAANGDMGYYSSATTKERLAIGTTNQVLTTVAGIPAWQSTKCCYLIANGNQNIPDTTQTTITSYSELIDTSGFHAPGDSVITIPAGLGGYYMVGCYGWFQNHASPGTARYVGVWLSSVSVVRSWGMQPQPEGTANAWMNVSHVYYLADASTIRMDVIQNSGASITFNAYGLWCVRIPG